MNFGIEKLKNMPLCNRLLRNIHSELMLGLRGKYLGEFRKSQNWIGRLDSKLKNASYIPAAPHELSALLSNFEKYLNDESAKYPLIQIALLHYQFEGIHPFLDGNKRIGAHAMLVFLALNGIESEYTQQELIDLILSVAASKADAEALLQWIIAHQI